MALPILRLCLRSSGVRPLGVTSGLRGLVVAAAAGDNWTVAASSVKARPPSGDSGGAMVA